MAFHRTQISFLIGLFLLTYSGCTQIEKENNTNGKIIKAAKEMMQDTNTCALITIDIEGRPRVRTMDPFPPEKDFTVWFGTNIHSRKVGQIKKNNRVTLYYLDKDATGYVTIHGTAEIVNDSSSKEKYWKEAWKNFYPVYPEGYALIKVTPLWMEVISETRGILGDDKTWQPQKITFN